MALTPGPIKITQVRGFAHQFYEFIIYSSGGCTDLIHTVASSGGVYRSNTYCSYNLEGCTDLIHTVASSGGCTDLIHTVVIAWKVYRSVAIAIIGHPVVHTATNL